MKPIYIIFSGEGPTLEFVEVEDAEGNGVEAGEWAQVGPQCEGDEGCGHPGHKPNECVLPEYPCDCTKDSSGPALQCLGPFYTKGDMLEVLNKAIAFSAGVEDFVSYYRLRKRIEETS